MRTGYILFAHGSRLESGNQVVRDAAARLARTGGFDLVDIAFLDCAPPDLLTTATRIIQQGAERIIVIPYFLTPGRHTAEDLPRIAKEVSRIHTGVEIVVTETLDGHPALAEILLDRARQARPQQPEDSRPEGQAS